MNFRAKDSQVNVPRLRTIYSIDRWWRNVRRSMLCLSVSGSANVIWIISYFELWDRWKNLQPCIFRLFVYIIFSEGYNFSFDANSWIKQHLIFIHISHFLYLFFYFINSYTISLNHKSSKIHEFLNLQTVALSNQNIPQFTKPYILGSW